MDKTMIAGLAMAMASAAPAAADPLAPTTTTASATVSPLAAVTVATSDMATSLRFYGQAMGMECLPATLTGTEAKSFRHFYGVPGTGSVHVATCVRPSGGASVNLVEVPAPTPLARAEMDSRLVGPLSMGFPSADNSKLDARVTALGFASTAGLTKITLTRPEGGSYDVGEVHYRAPENIYALGIDRGAMDPVGHIDAATGVGGPAYSGMMVGDIAAISRVFRDVLGWEARRTLTLTTSGPQGGLGLPTGTQFYFQQWYSPGATSGYVILMKLLSNGKPAAHPLGFASRGIAMWSFTAPDLGTIAARARAARVRILREPQTLGPARRAMLIATDDGFPIEIVEGPIPHR